MTENSCTGPLFHCHLAVESFLPSRHHEKSNFSIKKVLVSDGSLVAPAPSYYKAENKPLTGILQHYSVLDKPDPVPVSDTSPGTSSPVSCGKVPSHQGYQVF